MGEEMLLKGGESMVGFIGWKLTIEVVVDLRVVVCCGSQ
jgi:hypothetical protein